MSDYSSFTKFEHVMVHRYRDRLNHAENVDDVRQCFAQSARDLLGQVTGDTVAVADEDIALAPDLPQGYELAPRLIADQALARIWSASDLPTILGRMAETASHRYRHLDKRRFQSDGRDVRR